MSLMQTMARQWRAARTHIHFIHLHYFYFFCLIFVFTGLFYIQPGTTWAFIDAFFMATSSCTNSGLNTIAVSALSNYQTVVVFFGTFFGSQVGMSLWIVLVRRYYFSKRFDEMLLFNQAQRLREQSQRRRKRRKMQRKKQQQQPFHRRFSLASFHKAEEEGRDPNKKEALEKQPAQQGLDEGVSPVASGIAFADDLEQQRAHARHRFEQSRRKAWPNDRDDDNDDDGDDATTDVDPEMDELERRATKILQQLDSRHHAADSDDVDDEQEGEETDGDDDDDDEHDLGSMHRDGSGLPASSSTKRRRRRPLPGDKLTQEERYHLGGVEYRALDFLAVFIPCYYFLFVIVFAFMIRVYVAASTYAQNVLQTSNPTPVDPWLFSFFLSLSAFNNLGLNMLDASMVPFDSSAAPLILTIVLILAGNTAYPIILRSTLWMMRKLTPSSRAMFRETLTYLLENSRRCYTHLFPKSQTLWLLAILIAINVGEVISQLALNYWLPVLDDVTWGYRILDSIFQAVATRNAGFSVYNIGGLNPASQMIQVMAMYVSVYPVAISIRNSNVYQERSLGIYHTQDESTYDTNVPEGPSLQLRLRRHPTVTSMVTASKKVLWSPNFFVLQQIQKQMSTDLGWLALGVLIITMAEATRIMDTSPITVWSIVYECVSAFGNVGTSLGYPNSVLSQSGEYRVLSKLALIMLMYRGRHRGLPSSVDRAVMLPSDAMHASELEDQRVRRRASMHSMASTPHMSRRASSHVFAVEK
ncbi:cation transport protein-domain-containing protein [Gongronella butleri]|nr:cation transport protein-domain-containing protein [Gongronella butleri]